MVMFVTMQVPGDKTGHESQKQEVEHQIDWLDKETIPDPKTIKLRRLHYQTISNRNTPEYNITKTKIIETLKNIKFYS